MSLSSRQRATFKAALCLIRDSGHDVAAVNRDIQTRLGMGTPPRKAYEGALNGFVARTPGMLAPLQRAAKLIEASDDRTVARYNVALSRYIETGDDSAVNELAPMVAQDMVALAVRTGEAAPDIPRELEAIMVRDTATEPPLTERFGNPVNAPPPPPRDSAD
jgi:hypothetical protein